uniref:Uncharacterized protein n=1 Tax=Caenorhabditis japonica TaxID=281687 RepID=A0A8R1IPD4_CAEJA
MGRKSNNIRIRIFEFEADVNRQNRKIIRGSSLRAAAVLVLGSYIPTIARMAAVVDSEVTMNDDTVN